MNLSSSFRLISFTFFFSFLSTPVFAQLNFIPGYIITAENDTIYGEVSKTFLNNYSECKFKKEGQVQKYVASEIKGYGYTNGECFASQIVDGVFLELLVKGTMSLYSKENVFYVQKEGEEVYTLSETENKVSTEKGELVVKSSRWRGVLALLVEKYPQLKKKVFKIHFSERPLTTLVAKYNKLEGDIFEEPKSTKKWIDLQYTVQLGKRFSEIQIKKQGGGKFDGINPDKFSTTGFQGGLLLDISSPRTGDYLALETGVLFSKQSFSKEVYRKPIRTEIEAEIDQAIVSVPILGKLNLKTQKNNVFFKGGVLLNLFMDHTTRVSKETEQVDESIYFYPEDKLYDARKQVFSLTAGLGYMRKIGAISVGIGVDYLYANDVGDTIFLDVNQSDWMASFILKFD